MATRCVGKKAVIVPKVKTSCKTECLKYTFIHQVIKKQKYRSILNIMKAKYSTGHDTWSQNVHLSYSVGWSPSSLSIHVRTRASVTM